MARRARVDLTELALAERLMERHGWGAAPLAVAERVRAERAGKLRTARTWTAVAAAIRALQGPPPAKLH